MIIDSHAHYSHKLYEGEFTYLDWKQGEYCIREGNRRLLLEEMARRGIIFSIEAGTQLEKAETQLTVAAEYASCVRPALGIHPKHCAHLPAEAIEQLRTLVAGHQPLAIGETGLDYSVPPEELDKASQQYWFVKQIELAHEMGLPLILHIRDAYADALDILRQHRDILHGGVAHCFAGDLETAMACVELGFALGIGGRLLQDDDLQAVVAGIPLSAILVETDAPYIRPDISHLPGTGKQRKKVRNSSLILPAVIEKVASARGEAPETVEEAVFQNTRRVFRLNEI